MRNAQRECGVFFESGGGAGERSHAVLGLLDDLVHALVLLLRGGEHEDLIVHGRPNIPARPKILEAVIWGFFEGDGRREV